MPYFHTISTSIDDDLEFQTKNESIKKERHQAQDYILD